ncbi:cyclic nucleotide-gated ion channel 2-like [Oryza brachyantha]|uniref:cyclic nucleotide-gated ion channel 2-like n=1 Tax=Oryza brachyantha TaxID=4533 RepID=UPI00077625BB|nr:cyclic nucleotide-gated ion channel 2-like [Oryza brachyantha]
MYMDVCLAAAVTALRTSHLRQPSASGARPAPVSPRLHGYICHESLIVGCGKLVWDPRAIATHTTPSPSRVSGSFIFLPIPQVPKLRKDYIDKVSVQLKMVCESDTDDVLLEDYIDEVSACSNDLGA